VTYGRESEVAEILDREEIDSPWLHAGRAVLARDFRRAADIFAEAGALTPEAFFRLHAGSEPDVRAALAFYRSVGATRFIREGEAVLTASA
jgi:hypothetical protein